MSNPLNQKKLSKKFKRICYSQSKSSLIFPLVSPTHGLVKYATRLFPPDPDKPKYMMYHNPNVPRDVVGFPVISNPEPNGILMVTEDYISAYKASLVEGVIGFPCMGVSFPHHFPNLTDFATVVLYLDNDNWQVRQAQAKASRFISAFCDVTNVWADRDLKELTLKEIEGIVYGT